MALNIMASFPQYNAFERGDTSSCYISNSSFLIAEQYI